MTKLENILIGISPISDSVFLYTGKTKGNVGIANKKHDITGMFINAMVMYLDQLKDENEEVVFESEDEKIIINIQRIKK